MAFFVFFAAAAAQQEEGHGGHALANGEAHVKGDRCQGKQHQAQREDRDIRPEEPGDPFIQGASLPVLAECAVPPF